MFQVRRPPGFQPQVSAGPVPLRTLPALVLVAAQFDAAHRSATRRTPQIPLRELHQSIQRSQQPTAAHPHAPRRRKVARLPGVRENVRNFLRAETAHAHTLQCQTFPVRGLL